MYRRHRLPQNPLACLAILRLPSTEVTEEFRGRVVGVSDRDTITDLYDGRAEKIWLYGIDCPERRQALERRSREFSSSALGRGKPSVGINGGHEIRGRIQQAIGARK